jgi:quercetin dioxygenase-like cupin family protein
VTASALDRFRSRALFPLGDPHAPEVYEVTLAPNCYQRARPHDRNTFEHLTIVRGVLVVQTDDRVARLGPGDTLFFRADVPHSYRNATSSETVVHLVVTHV